MLIIYDDFFLKHYTGQFHVENAQRLMAIKNTIQSSVFSKKLNYINPTFASEEQVGLVHTHSYIERIKNLSEKKSLFYIDPDTVVSGKTYECALLAAGACLNGIDFLCKGKYFSDAQNQNENQNESQKIFFALVRPPGHHAFADHGSGFCIFNNISIAARYALTVYKQKRIVIIDIDVHHGNGTQDIFYHDDSVFYSSIHQYPHYPGTGYWTETGGGVGKSYNLNIPLTEFSKEADYIMAFTDIIIPLLLRYNPGLILVSTGFDAHFEDPLSSINLKDESFYKIMKMILYLSGLLGKKNNNLSIPVGLVLEGGYSHDAAARSVLKIIEACLEGFFINSKKGLKDIRNLSIDEMKEFFLTGRRNMPTANAVNLKTFESIKEIFEI